MKDEAFIGRDWMVLKLKLLCLKVRFLMPVRQYSIFNDVPKRKKKTKKGAPGGELHEKWRHMVIAPHKYIDELTGSRAYAILHCVGRRTPT